MKKLFGILFSIAILVLCLSCEKLFNKDEDPGTLSGDQSAMGEVGTTVTSSSMEIGGVSNFSASVIALKSGVSSYSGSATCKNDFLKSLLTNIPGVSIEGDKISATNIEFKSTKEGIEFKTGPTAGIWVKYSSNVGDTYPIGSTGEVRKVVAKTGVDDYPYGFMLIKVVQVEENHKMLKSTGISKITYVANHKFGLVGVNFAFDDGTSTTFPIYTSAEN
jgi:hypothetical protein